MGKVRRIISLVRRKEFFIGVGATFTAILALASAILTVIGQHFELAGTILFLAAALCLSCIWHYRRLNVPQVAVDDVIASGVFEYPQTRLRCPCDSSLAEEAKRLAAQCYAGTITIDPIVYEQFRAKNPLILGCLTDSRGEFLGYFDALPLKEPFAKLFLRGITTEAQIRHEDVLREDEIASCKYLFVCGFAVRNPHSHAGRRNASMLAWALLKYMDAYYSSARPLVFAVAATRAGDDLLERFRLDLKSSGADRIDRYRLYSLVLTQEQIVLRLQCLPDWERICLLDWATENGGRSHRPALPKARAWQLAAGTSGTA